MSQYERTITVQADADQVFTYLSDVQNLPKFLPTVREATSLGGDRIHMSGESHGHAYESDGYFRVDAGAHRIEWGAEGERGYHGTMVVQRGDTTDLLTEITVTLHFPGDDRPERGERILEEMQTTLVMIEREVEGHRHHPGGH